MKKRERRRYLTHKYQQKQVRLSRRVRQQKPYDPERYLQRTLAKKQRFVDELRGNIVGPEWSGELRKLRTSLMLDDDAVLTKKRLGRFRNHSFSDCGRPKCWLCSNPRRGYTATSYKDRKTKAEQIADLKLKEELELYYEGGDFDE